MKSFNKIIAVLLVMVMTLTILPVSAFTASAETTTSTATSAVIKRMGGTDRFDTAIQIAKEGWTSADTVVLASADSYADALAGAPLAYALDAPIMLVRGSSVDGRVMAQIKALGAKTVYLLGGTVAISAEIEDELDKAGFNVIRIWDSTRYGTAVAIAKELARISGKPSEIFIASGVNYPDALSASSIAAIKRSPILYSPENGTLDAATVAFINDSGAAKAYVLGGVMAVGHNIDENLKSAGINDFTRLGGTDRYDTSLIISKQFDAVFTSNDVSFATGKNYPDALAGGVFAAMKGVPVLLTDNENVNSEFKDYIAGKDPAAAYIFGGTSVVSDEIVKGHLPVAAPSTPDVPVTPEEPETPVVPETPVTPTPSVTRYKVSFEANGENVENMPAAQNVKRGQYATEPDEPTREGYEFACWSLDDSQTFSFDSKITTNITLYAQWKKITTNSNFTYEQSEENLVFEEAHRKYYYNNLINVYTINVLSSDEADSLAQLVNGSVVARVDGACYLQILVKESTYDDLEKMIHTLLNEKETVASASFESPITMSDFSLTDNNPWVLYGESVNDNGNEAKPSGNDWWAEAIRAYTAWEYAEYAKPITVGVLDGGFFDDHTELKGKISYPIGFDANTAGNHGTSVASIIAAKNNDVGLRGVADFADLVCVDWDVDTNPDFWGNDEYISATEAMLNSGAKIINNSWGNYFYNEKAYKKEKSKAEKGEDVDSVFTDTDTYDEYVECMEGIADDKAADTIRMMIGFLNNPSFDDFLIVQAAGNGYNNDAGESGCDARFSGYYAAITEELFNEVMRESNYSDLSIEYSDIDQRILIVSSVDNDTIELFGKTTYKASDYASYGETVDIYAPGEFSIAKKSGTIFAATHLDYYSLSFGTSLAAPMVSGAAAFIWALDPTLDAPAVRRILLDNCTPAVRLSDTDDYDALVPMLNVGKAVEYTVSQISELQISIVDDDTGTPIFGMEFVISSLNSDYSITGRTDIKGGYTVVLPDGSYEIEIKESKTESTVRTIGLDDDLIWIYRTTIPQFAVSGSVIDEASKTPLSGVSISAKTAIPESANTKAYETVTDKDGRYNLSLPYDAYSIEFSKEGYNTTSILFFVEDNAVVDTVDLSVVTNDTSNTPAVAFENYLNTALADEYGFSDLKEYLVFDYSYGRYDCTVPSSTQGILTWEIGDFDGDGADEMIVVVLEEDNRLNFLLCEMVDGKPAVTSQLSGEDRCSIPYAGALRLGITPSGHIVASTDILVPPGFSTWADCLTVYSINDSSITRVKCYLSHRSPGAVYGEEQLSGLGYYVFDENACDFSATINAWNEDVAKLGISGASLSGVFSEGYLTIENSVDISVPLLEMHVSGKENTENTYCRFLSSATSFDAIIDEYKIAKENNFFADELDSEDGFDLASYLTPHINSEVFLAMRNNPDRKIYYTIVDIGSDTKIIIFTIGSPSQTDFSSSQIFDIFGIRNHRIYPIFDQYSMGYRSNYYFCTDDVVRCLGSGGASLHSTTYYQINDDLSFSVIDELWINGDEYSRNGATITENDYYAALNELESTYTNSMGELSWTVID